MTKRRKLAKRAKEHPNKTAHYRAMLRPNVRELVSILGSVGQL